MLKKRLSVLVLVVLVLVASGGLITYTEADSPSAKQSRITRIEISNKISPAFGGTSFGSVGRYEFLVGKVYGVANPRSSRNKGIIDLDKAPRNDQGMVEYSADIAILKPIDVPKGNGQLLYDVLNRGRKFSLVMLLGTANFAQPVPAQPTGDTTLLEQGFTWVWSGWQSDFPSTANAVGGGAMAAVFPIATENGKALVGTSHEEIRLDGSALGVAAVAPSALTFQWKLTYPSMTLDSSKIALYYRKLAASEPMKLDASSIVRFIDERTIEIKRPNGTDLGAIFNLYYPATQPIVMGLAFVSVRDVISFLRYAAVDESGKQNPLFVAGKSSVKRAIATGASQSGRFLRDYVYQDFNIDEKGRRIFDGVVPTIAGAKRAFINYRFAQPNVSPQWQHDYWGFPGAQFPFTYATLFDPISGKTDGLLKRCSESKSCPKIMQVDTESETWGSYNSLVVTDTTGKPLVLPKNVRAYLIASLAHVPGNPTMRAFCQQLLNPLSLAAPWRALLADMGQWVGQGIEPPTSRYPSRPSDGRVSVDQLAAMFPRIPGAPFNWAVSKPYPVDYSRVPWPVPAAFYPVSVTRVNADGNGMDGVVMPQVAVPIATYSGRNTRAEGFAQDDLCSIQGSYIPFAKTKAERITNNDPRPSLEERYTDNVVYQTKLKAMADKLVAERLLLPSDAASIVKNTLP
ncbi:MAG: hypothetical protein HY879_27225 [Deltaproteobacteria bacterium]|nr:hypothetical protein [Deltaproteobacteria bacterium]